MAYYYYYQQAYPTAAQSYQPVVVPQVTPYYSPIPASNLAPPIPNYGHLQFQGDGSAERREYRNQWVHHDDHHRVNSSHHTVLGGNLHLAKMRLSSWPKHPSPKVVQARSARTRSFPRPRNGQAIGRRARSSFQYRQEHINLRLPIRRGSQQCGVPNTFTAQRARFQRRPNPDAHPRNDESARRTCVRPSGASGDLRERLSRPRQPMQIRGNSNSESNNNNSNNAPTPAAGGSRDHDDLDWELSASDIELIAE